MKERQYNTASPRYLLGEEERKGDPYGLLCDRGRAVKVVYRCDPHHPRKAPEIPVFEGLEYVVTRSVDGTMTVVYRRAKKCLHALRPDPAQGGSEALST